MVEVLKRIIVACVSRWVLAIGLAWTCAYAQENAPKSDPLPLAETFFPPLVELLAQAVKQAPRAINANLEFLIAQENIGIQRSRMLPSAGGYLTYSYAQDRRLDRDEPLNAAKLAYNFSVTQPVFHWGALKAGHNFGKISAKIAENNAAEASRLLVLELRSSYLRLIVLKAAKNRADLALRIAEAELSYAKGQLKAGAIAPGEMLGPDTKFLQSQIDAERAAEEYRFTKMSVERLAGVAPIDETSIPVLIPAVPYPKDRIKALAEHFAANEPEAGNFRLAIAQLRVDQEKLNYQILDKSLRPKFNVITGVNQDEVSYTGSPADRARTQSIYGGLNVTWAIFDGFLTPTQRRASRLRLRQLEADRDDRRREMVELVQTQAKQIEFAARGMVLSDNTLDQYNLLVKTKREDIERGRAAKNEIEPLTIARDSIQLQAMANRADLMARIAELISTLGRDPALSQLVSPRS